MKDILKHIFNWISQIVQSVIVIVLVRNVMRVINAIVKYVKTRIVMRRKREELNKEIETKLAEIRKEREQIEETRDQIKEYFDSIPVDPELKESVEKCRSIGVDERKIIHTKEEGERYFMSEEAVDF